MIEDPFIHAREGADALEPGFFLVPMRRSGRIDVPIRIWFGPPEDPEYREYLDANAETGRSYTPIADRVLLDRSPRWQIEINGVLYGDPDYPACIAGRPVDDLEEIWPRAKIAPIDQAEYEYRVARAEHAEQHDANDPFGGTGGKVDPMTATLPFS